MITTEPTSSRGSAASCAGVMSNRRINNNMTLPRFSSSQKTHRLLSRKLGRVDLMTTRPSMGRDSTDVSHARSRRPESEYRSRLLRISENKEVEMRKRSRCAERKGRPREMRLTIVCYRDRKSAEGADLSKQVLDQYRPRKSPNS